MAYQDLSEPLAVLDAIIEFDEIGREAFLAKYGFAGARSYFINYDGKLYDTKPVVAAAHGYQFGDPLPNSFSGGEATMVPLLEGLGFDVTHPEQGTRLPTWSRDELILGLDAYLRRRGLGGWSKTTKEAIELSAELRGLVIFPDAIRENPRFRNAAGVALKVSNFAAIDPVNDRVGMEHGSRGDQSIWDEWAHRPDELHTVALAILAATDLPDAREPTNEEDEEASAEEGRLLYRLHRRFERDRKLVKAKKDAVRTATGRLACEVCDFESSEVYGEGIAVIDVHHIVPLHKIGESKTTLSELALVCPTCHRVVHAHKPFVTPAQLRTRRAIPR